MRPAGCLVTIRRNGVDGARFPLSLRSCLLGRGIECDIRIQLPVVSKQHCKIEINEQEAILYNFSSKNPTQVNGSVIDEPVSLKHGDVITIIDRSFRYENESQQNGSQSTEIPGKTPEQEPVGRASRASFSADPAWKDQDSRVHSTPTEGKAAGKPVVLVKTRTGAGPSERGLGDAAAGQPPGTRPSAQGGSRAGRPAPGDLPEKSSVAVSSCGGRESVPSPQARDSSKRSESPFRKLYQSMKEELDDWRKSGSQARCATEEDSADALQRETRLLVPRKSRPSSGRRAPVRAGPSSPEPAPSQTEGTGSSGQPVPRSQEAACSGLPPCEKRTRAPVRQDGDLTAVGGPASLQTAGGATRDQTPAKAGGAASPGNTPGRLPSRKRRSIPANAEVLATEVQSKPLLTQCLAQVGKKILKDPLNKPEKLGTISGQICSGLPGLSSVDISNFGDSTNKSEAVPLKKRRVSFGGCLRPELFDENLPPNTPIKRGETPAKRKSLVTHTPAVLKKVIKEQQSPGRQSSSEICLEVKAQSTCTAAPAPGPPGTPGPEAQRRRSGKAVAAPGGRSPGHTEAARKGGRKSGHLPPKRASVSRSQHGILQMICSRRRSGASEANLIVAKSWADVVKLGAKQTQTKVLKHGPQRQVNKRPRRANTPKKPLENTHSQFSTGHANSPCTIIIGKAQIAKGNAPARPYRMLNSFVFNQKLDYNEDLSGLTEMFKTPVKEEPQVAGMSPGTLPSPDDERAGKSHVTNSGNKLLHINSEILGESVFSGPPHAARGPSDEYSASPAFRRKGIKAGESAVETPREMALLEMETPGSATQPLRAVSSVSRSRRSVELGQAPMPPGEREGEAEAGIPGSLRGGPAGETAGGGREPAQPRGSFGKTAAARRSGRSGSQKEEATAGPADPRRTLGTEAAGHPPGRQAPRTPRGAADPGSSEDGAASPCGPPRPEPAPPAPGRSQSKAPLGEVLAREEACAPRPRAHSSGQAQAPGGGRRSTSVRGGTPQAEARPLEDLTGFRELFQTPRGSRESLTDDKGNAARRSPPPAAVGTRAWSQARPGTPQRADARRGSPALGKLRMPGRAQPPEDLAGRADGPDTDGAAETPCTSSQPEPARTAASRRRPSASLQRVDVKEERSALRTPAQSPGRATRTPTVLPQEERCTRASTETPEQTPTRTRNVLGLKRRSKTPKEKAQPPEDLAGLPELFRTPGRARSPNTADQTAKTPCTSLQPEPVRTPAASKRRPSSSLQRVDVKEERSALRTPAQSPGRATRTPTVQPQGERCTRASAETPEQTPTRTKNILGLKRRSKTNMEKAQPPEDLAGLKELFQTPGHARNPKTADETPKTPCRPPQPGPVDTPATSKRRPSASLQRVDVKEERSAFRTPVQSPGRATCTPTVLPQEERCTRASTETPEQTPTRTKNIVGLKRRSKTPKEKAQPPEDLAGLQELFQTPSYSRNPKTAGETPKTPCRPPRPGPVDTPAASKRRPKMSLERVDVKEEPPALGAPGRAACMPPVPAQQETHANASAETPRQTQGPTGHLSDRKRRVLKEKARPLEDLAGLQELFRTPVSSRDPKSASDIVRAPCRSPGPGPFRTPASTKGQPRSSSGKADVNREVSVLGKLAQVRGEATPTRSAPGGGDKPVEAPQESAKVASSRRLQGARKEKARPPEDLAGVEELFRTPVPARDPGVAEKMTRSPARSPGPVSTPTTSKKWPRMSLRQADVKEGLLGRRTAAQTPGRAAPVQGTLGVTALGQQTPGPREASPGLERLSRAPKERAQPLEDLSGLQELFQTPGQTPDQTENVAGLKRRSKTPKERAQPPEDLAGLPELFRTPGRARSPNTSDQTAKTPCTSLQPEPVRTPAASKRRPSSSLQRVDMKEERLALRTPAQSPGRAMHTPTVLPQEERCTRASAETPEQTLDQTENVAALKRRSKTPKEKAQPLEDLAGLPELFQTPGQTPDQTENVAGLKRRSKTPKEKAQPAEDLSGLQELFQTPGPARNPKTAGETPKTPCRPPQPGPVAPAASKRRPSTSLQRVDVKEEHVALRTPAQSPGRATHTPTVLPQEERCTRASAETPEQTLDQTENVAGLKRRSKTPNNKVQPPEDLSGLQELFQTPSYSRNPKTAGETPKTPCRPPQPGPVAPAASKRRPSTSLQRVDVKEEHLALRTPAQSPGRATSTPTVLPQEERCTRASAETPEQTLDQTENVARLKRRSKTPKEKAQPPEDLAGLQELFQAPSYSRNPKTAGETPKTPCRPPQPGPVAPAASKRRPKMSLERVDVKEERSALRKQTPTLEETVPMHQESTGPEESIRMFKKPAKRKLDPEENITGRKRLRGAAREKAQPHEGQAGFQEPFQTSDPTEEAKDGGRNTEMPCTSLEPVDTPPAPRRQLRARLRKAGVTEALSAQGTATGASAETTDTRDPDSDGRHAQVPKESAKRKLGAAPSRTGSKRLRGAPKEEGQPPGVLAAPREPVHAAGRSGESTDEPCTPPPPGPAGSPARAESGPRARVCKAKGREEPSVVGKPTRASRRAPREPQASEGGVRAPEGSARQTLGPAGDAPASRRLRGAPRAKAQPPEDLAGPGEPAQTPGHSEESRNDKKPTKVPCKSPQPEPGATPPAPRRQLRARLRKAGVTEALSAQETATGALAETADSGDPDGDGRHAQVPKESAKRKLGAAPSRTGSKRLRGAPKEEGQPPGVLAAPREPVHAAGRSGESTDEPCAPPPPGPAGSPARAESGPRARVRKAKGKEEPSVVGKPTRATRRAPREPQASDGGVEAPEGSARQTLGPAGGAPASRRLRGAPRAKAQPPEDLAGPGEPAQTPGHSEELESVARSLKSSPEHVPGRARPLTASRRVLGAPKGEPAGASADRGAATSQSHASLLSRAKSGASRRVAGARGLHPALPVTPLQEAPRERAKAPEPSKRELRVFVTRTEPARAQKSSSRTKKEERQAEDQLTADKGISLRSRHQNKSDEEEKKPEFTVPAENVKIKRNASKPMKTSQEMALWNPDEGAEKPSRGKVGESPERLRPGRQSKAEDRISKRARGAPGVPAQNQQEKGVTGNPDRGVRSRKTGGQPRGSTLERGSEKRVTQGAKKCADDPKDKDIVYTKETRSRSRRGQ